MRFVSRLDLPITSFPKTISQFSGGLDKCMLGPTVGSSIIYIAMGNSLAYRNG
jgi:hypothetical protein